MKKLLALLMIWLLLPIAGAEEAYTMQDGSLILLDGAGRKCQPIAMKPDFPAAGGCGHIRRNPAESAGDAAAVCVG